MPKFNSQFVIAALAGLAVAGVSCSPRSSTKLQTLDLEPLANNAKPISLGDLHGKIVLLNFWGTWCAPCVEEFPHIAALERNYRGRSDFRLLCVSCGGGGPEDAESLRARTERFLTDGGYDLPVYADLHHATRDALQLSAYPTTYLIDRDGMIVGNWVGQPDFGELKLRIASLLQTNASSTSP